MDILGAGDAGAGQQRRQPVHGLDQGIEDAAAEQPGQRRRQRQVRDQIVAMLDPQQRHGIGGGEGTVADARRGEQDGGAHVGTGRVETAGGKRRRARRRRCGR